MACQQDTKNTESVSYFTMINDRLPRLIFASSEESADLLYATKFSVPDPVLFLKQKGKTTVLLSDLEIDRGKKEAKVDEVIALSSIESPLAMGLKESHRSKRQSLAFCGSAASGKQQFLTTFQSVWQTNWPRKESRSFQFPACSGASANSKLKRNCDRSVVLYGLPRPEWLAG